MTVKCNICGHGVSVLETYTGAPHSLMSMYHSDKLATRDVDIYRCKQCGHTQVTALVAEQYYEDYFLGSYWGSSFKEVRRKQMNALIELAPMTESFLDVGCGVGHYLELARNHFKHIYGIEPSESSATIAKEKGFHIIQDYFHEKLALAADFDAITMIEVLEHVEAPLQLVRLAADFLKEDGILLIEVPNGQRIVSNHLFYNVCTDHIQYFSIPSLTAMAQLAGMQVICVRECDDPNLLEMFLRKPRAKQLTFTEQRNLILHKWLTALPHTEKIAAWGAGAESAAFIHMLDGKVKLDCIFDSDAAKQGLYIDHIPIKQATKDNVNQYEHIVLFANAHHKQIKAQLDKLGFKGSLHVIDASV